MRSNQIVSVTDANQNFPRITKLAEKNGEVFIFKNNKPRFRLIDVEQYTEIEMTDDE